MGIVQAFAHDPFPNNGDVVNVYVGETSTSGFISGVPADTTDGNTLVCFAFCAYDGGGSITAVYDSVNGEWPAYLKNVLDPTYTNTDWKIFHLPGANAASLKATAASFTGSVNGASQVLTVSSVTGTIRIGQLLKGTSVIAQSRICGQISGTTGGAGTYQLNPVANTTIASEAMTTADAITVVQAAFSDYNGFVAAEISGGTSTGVSVVAGQAVNAAHATDAVTTGTAACGALPGIMIGLAGNGTTAHSPYAPAAGTGFTKYGNYMEWDIGQDDMTLEYEHFANPGTEAATWTPSGADGFVALMVFIPDAAGACTNEGYEPAGGAVAVPDGSTGSYLGNGATVTPDCSSIPYYQPGLGKLGVSAILPLAWIIGRRNKVAREAIIATEKKEN